jgi:MFS family permease
MIALKKSHFYYGWVNLVIASLAMVGTLPGRTQGLGLITEPLLRDLNIDRVVFAQINLWATLIGSLFAIGIGSMIDRFGSRIMLTIVSLSLGLTVLVMSRTQGLLPLGILITLMRGFGQSALSVISITIVGQWFVRRLSLAMAIYSVLLSIGFMVAFPTVGSLVLKEGWRVAWNFVGYSIVFLLAPAGFFLVRRSPEAYGLKNPKEMQPVGENSAETTSGFTLPQALSTAAFWVFALSSSVYGLVASGIALFNESILAERGFDASTYHRTLIITALTALIGNFLGGWLTEKWSVKRLMASAMALLAGSLFALPHVTTQMHVVLYALVMGLAGGFVIVIFFSFWSRIFGRAHLGQIQGAAQTLTVLGSAVGPLILAECLAITGSYAAIFNIVALVVIALGLAAWFVRIPKRETSSVVSEQLGMYKNRN